MAAQAQRPRAAPSHPTTADLGNRALSWRQRTQLTFIVRLNVDLITMRPSIAICGLTVTAVSWFAQQPACLVLRAG